MKSYTIKYLKQEEKNITRPFWEKVFEEDSKEFLDYYYGSRSKNNRILAKFSGEKPVSMLHLNPYKIAAKDRVWECNYIVAVATDEEERHKGHMRDLICRALGDMYDKGMPFAYLMPASEAIYLPFDFTYVYDQEIQEFIPGKGITFREVQKQELDMLQELSEELLAPKYDLYAVRDTQYMSLLWQEVTCDKGGIELALQGNETVGYQCLWGGEKREIRSLYGREGLVRAKKKAPAIMARIVNLPAFLRAVSAERELTLPLCVEDGILPDNCGSFLWHLTPDGSELERMEGLQAASVGIRLSIAELTAWLFGYESCERIAQKTGYDLEQLTMIRGFESVLLDEIV